MEGDLGPVAEQCEERGAGDLDELPDVQHGGGPVAAADEVVGQGAADAEDEDFEFMLRVMKMIQQEQDLRSRTRALEQMRRNFKTGKPSDEP